MTVFLIWKLTRHLQYLQLEQPGGVLEDDGLDVAADLDGVDGNARDKVEEDVVAVRPVRQWVRECNLEFYNWLS